MEWIQITKEATKKIQEINKSVVISLKSGGCAGMMINIDFVENKDILSVKGNDPAIITINETNQSIVTSKPESQLLMGGILDYEDSILLSGFVFKMPSRQTCGCKKSFSPAEYN